jgi:putative transposase
MSRSYYSEINLHITWHTKDSAPSLTPELEAVAHRDVRQRVFDTPGAIFHEIGGTVTHVHLAVSVPPTLTISDWIGQLKGGSSHAVNGHVSGRVEKFAWQEGYGVVSLATKNLSGIVAYVQNQKEHHANHTTRETLERISD